ncbi:hypothetical protein [Luteimonas sp. MC1750]|uniref:hypothetical protein n=1 Tax=Luteimonas sp. MC1750 TaxID=2799326 RepID=UPI0018F05E79|nr:hypothetical protein [Luteimonas sp. MC1750]MBJ6983991.1 hypothetical protein [Luteimonas sp. MC1750]QQO06803.1 hypothetical protein JGR68_05095 [Luteimonas sp. MC1750]
MGTYTQINFPQLGLSSHMKNVLSPLALAIAMVAAPSAFANDVTANVSATVPQQCEIVQVQDTDVTFAVGQTGSNVYQQMMVRCNLDQAFNITTPTTDAAGRFNITNGVQSMAVELTAGDLGVDIWDSSLAVPGVGTGEYQYFDYGLSFNPDSGYLPAVGTYTGTIMFSLTAL